MSPCSTRALSAQAAPGSAECAGSGVVGEHRGGHQAAPAPVGGCGVGGDGAAVEKGPAGTATPRPAPAMWVGSLAGVLKAVLNAPPSIHTDHIPVCGSGRSRGSERRALPAPCPRGRSARGRPGLGTAAVSGAPGAVLGRLGRNKGKVRLQGSGSVAGVVEVWGGNSPVLGWSWRRAQPSMAPSTR